MYMCLVPSLPDYTTSRSSAQTNRIFVLVKFLDGFYSYTDDDRYWSIAPKIYTVHPRHLLTPQTPPYMANLEFLC